MLSDTAYFLRGSTGKGNQTYWGIKSTGAEEIPQLPLAVME